MNKPYKGSENLIRLPHGVSDFKELVSQNYKFVDKTLFIKDVIDDGAKVIVITRPRRFGKTLNLSMLYHFLKHQDRKTKGENLFRDLEISKYEDFCKEHQHQYPVIFFSFKDIKQPTYNEAYEDIVELIRQLYEEHRYLLEGNVVSESEKNIFTAVLNKQASSSDVKSAIQMLSKHMEKRFKKKPIILIDEYDTPIQEAYLEDYYKRMIKLMRSILGKALKDNDYLDTAVVTGITRVSQESLFSGVNNLEVYSLLREDYGEYFGFTETEVVKLISETKQKISIDSVKNWYNGYQIGRNVLYNPWSIISCLKNRGQLKPYWLNTSSNALIRKLLSEASTSVKHKLEALIQGKSIKQTIYENLIFPDIKTQSGALWSLLLSAGYLKVLSTRWDETHGLIAEIALPNKEVTLVYNTIIINWINNAFDSESYDQFVQSLHNGDLDKFKVYISNYLIQTSSYFDFTARTPEKAFHVFILGLVIGLRQYYDIDSNKESGFGRFDMIFLPKDKEKRGIILEFKNAKTPASLLAQAKEGLKQIKDNRYIEEFRRHKIKSILAIGLSFCGKAVELAHETINLK